MSEPVFSETSTPIKVLKFTVEFCVPFEPTGYEEGTTPEQAAELEKEYFDGGETSLEDLWDTSLAEHDKVTVIAGEVP